MKKFITNSQSLIWRGDDIKDRVREAAIKGVDDVMLDASRKAGDLAPKDTGAMASGIRVLERAHPVQGGVAGVWGNNTESYTIWQEIGSQGRAGKYFLRRGGDHAYSKLATRIKRHLL